MAMSTKSFKISSNRINITENFPLQMLCIGILVVVNRQKKKNYSCHNQSHKFRRVPMVFAFLFFIFNGWELSNETGT